MNLCGHLIVRPELHMLIVLGSHRQPLQWHCPKFSLVPQASHYNSSCVEEDSWGHQGQLWNGPNGSQYLHHVLKFLCLNPGHFLLDSEAGNFHSLFYLHTQVDTVLIKWRSGLVWDGAYDPVWANYNTFLGFSKWSQDLTPGGRNWLV